jgi:hypothetical protein
MRQVSEKFRPCLKEKTPGIDRAFSLITRRRRCGAAGNRHRVAALFVGRLSTEAVSKLKITGF